MAKHDNPICESCVHFIEWTRPGRYYRCAIYSRRTFMMADMKCESYEPSLEWEVRNATLAMIENGTSPDLCATCSFCEVEPFSVSVSGRVTISCGKCVKHGSVWPRAHCNGYEKSLTTAVAEAVEEKE